MKSAMRVAAFISLAIPVVILLAGFAILPLRAQQTIAGGITRIDPALHKLVPPGAKVEKVRGGFRFIEGPVWVRNGGYLLFSDVPANSIMRWTHDGTVSVFREPIFSGTYPDGAFIGSNGLTLDRLGRLVADDHGNRRVTRFEKDGSITVLADRYEGKRLNSPNDVITKSNGDIYFTDPPGLLRSYPTDAKDIPQEELDFSGVYRITAAGELNLLTKGIPYPNGLAFSPDEKKLYIANSRPDKFWMVYDVKSDGTLANGRKFFDATKVPGEDVPDGMKVDTAGNVYATGPAGIMIFSPKGKLLGTIQFPELPANCAWGDVDGKTLYVTARTGLYRVRLNIAGIQP
jgi:gluconolactonase